MFDKEAIKELVELGRNQTHEINGYTYSDRHLELIETPYQFPRTTTLGSLDGIVKMIKTEIGRFHLPLFISAYKEGEVLVSSTYDSDFFKRADLYQAKTAVKFSARMGMSLEQAIIYIRTAFIRNADSDYVLNLLSSVSQEDNIKNDDNGITQTVTAKTGIAMKANVTVKPIVTLRPYRTFLEVEQPESDFILRMGEGPTVSLFEADGGMWKIHARKNIKGYFEENLKDEIGRGDIIVTI